MPPPKWPCSAARAEDESRSRFANLRLGSRFNNKWSYKSEEITAIFLAAAAEEEEEQEKAAHCCARWKQINICMEENNRHSCGKKTWFPVRRKQAK